jgi:hypothetical protein
VRPFHHQDLIILNNDPSGSGDWVLIKDIAARVIGAESPDPSFAFSLQEGFAAKRAEAVAAEIVFACEQLLGIELIVLT